MPSQQSWKQRFDQWFSQTKQDFTNIEEIWSAQSEKFKCYWNDKILNPEAELKDEDLKEIIKILDTNAKGNVRAIAVASLYLRQNIQEYLLKGIKADQQKQKFLNTFFTSEDDDARIEAIDELSAYESRMSGPKLTSQYGVFLNAICYAYDPANHLNIVSLDKEKNVIETFKIPNDIDFNRDSYGKKIVMSNRALLDFFRNMGVIEHTYVVASFIWTVINSKEPGSQDENPSIGTFALEKHLEDFLVYNWDNIQALKPYKILTNKDGEIIGRQYPAGTGRIDILATHRDTDDYVVIELKRNQTSDAVAGQILRYMNWVKLNMANGKNVSGMIIAGDIDENLRLSLHGRSDISLLKYEMDFKLQ